MNLFKTGIVILGLSIACVISAFNGYIEGPILAAFPIASVLVLSLGITNYRSSSFSSFFALIFISTYNLVNRLRYIGKDLSLQEVTCHIDGDQLVTNLNYLGVSVRFYTNAAELSESYLELIEEGELVVNDVDNSVAPFIQDKEIHNCSSCPNFESYSAVIEVEWSLSPRIKWSASFCSSCMEKIVKEQLRVLSTETEFESKVVISEL